MQHRRIRKAIGLIMMMVTFTSMTVAANDISTKSQVQDKGLILAAEESETLGSITIILEDSEHNRPKENVVFNVTKVADVTDGKFVLKEKYADTAIDLNNLKTANEMDEACKKIQPFASKEVEVVTNKEGIAIAEKLPVGVYFISATDIAEYDYIKSFLISIPTWNDLEKKMEYNVEAHPKHSEIIGTIKTNIPSNFSEGVKTGDSSNYMRWIYLASIALVGILSVLAYKLYRKSKCDHKERGKNEK